MAVVIVCVWLNNSRDPHYGGHRRAAESELTVLASLRSNEAIVLTDCLTPGRRGNVEFVRVDSLGGNPYHDRWRHFGAWLDGRNDEWVWSVDANDVTLLNDPYPAGRDPDALYVGSEPVSGPNARSVGFWWMRQLHPDHADWINEHADLPLLNAGLLGGTPAVLREFVGEVLDALDESTADVTEMAAVNRVLHDGWSERIAPPTWHTPMWSFVAAHPSAIWAHK